MTDVGSNLDDGQFIPEKLTSEGDFLEIYPTQ